MDISSMLEVQVNEVKGMDIKENVTPKDMLPSTTNISLPISQEELNCYKSVFGNDISTVRFQRLHCTACDTHIGSAPADSSNMFEHPVLHTLLCARCREFYGDGTFEQGDDATDMFCRWCANGGNLYCCSFCSNTFCSKCIKRNFDSPLRKKIEADEKWKCFVCDPKDLYSARATCWALLEYVQRMNRFLQNNSKLSQPEIDEKMNLDEAKCCTPRRRKRRRRFGSISEDEDDTTYRPNYTTNSIKRKKRGRKPKYLLTNSNVSNISQSGASEESSLDHNEILPSLLSCEQTMIEGENVTVNTDGTVVSQSQTSSVTTKSESTVQQPIYNTIVNVVATSNFLQPTSSVIPLRQVPGSLNQMNLYQAVRCNPTPMVTIPNQNTSMLNRIQRFPSQPPPLAAISNVIEIESDSEDTVDVGPSRDSRSFKDHIDNNKAVPVALVSSKNNYNNAKKQDTTIERRSNITLNQRLLSYSQEVDTVLSGLKGKLQDVFNTWKREESKKYELNEARTMVKRFHHEMRETVTLLACINDRVVREYNKWKRLQIKTGAIHASDNDNMFSKVKNEQVPLDMICVNESDSEPESESENSFATLSPSEFVGSTSIIEGMKSFRKRTSVTRAVGNDDPTLFVDKSVQIYDVELQDYDKCIRHSAMKLFDQQSKLETNPLTSSAEEENKHSENYEEQFIHYLQKRSEPEDVEEDECKNLPDPNETPLKDLIEANSPFISEMLETMDKPPVVSNNVNSLNVSSNEDSNSKSPAVQTTTNFVKSKPVDDFEQMVNNITNAINSKKAKTQDRKFFTSDEIRVVNLLKNNEQDSSRTKRGINSVNSCESNCTIIND